MEKKMIGVIAVLFVLCFISIMSTMNKIEKADGISQISIDVGKEFKHIGQEIAKD